MKKIVLIIGLLTSVVALAEKNNVEIRASVDLDNNAHYKVKITKKSYLL